MQVNDKLKTKGWSAKEIKHAHRVLKRADKKKHPAYKFLEVAVFWALLFITVLGMFLISLVIMPLLLVLPLGLLILILAIFGLCLGSLFAILIPDIEWLEKKHHAFNIIILAALAVLNVWLIVTKVDAIAGSEHPGLLLGAIFALALLLPYIFHLCTRK